MSREKSKELYAKSIIHAMGELDDALLLEALEADTNTVESTAYRVRRYLPRIAASFLFVAVIALAILLGRQMKFILPTGYGDESSEVGFAQGERAADICCRFEAPSEDEPDRSYIVLSDFGSAEFIEIAVLAVGEEKTNPAVLCNGSTPETVSHDDGISYYRIPVAGVESVRLALIGVRSPEEVELRLSVGKNETPLTPSV